MDPQIMDFLKLFGGPTLTGGAGFGFYLLYRKFEAERAASLREDNKTLRSENKELREELRKAEDDNDKLRRKLRSENE